MAMTHLARSARRLALWSTMSALLVSGFASATSSRAAAVIHRVAGKIAYYNPTEARVSGNGRYVVFSAWLSPLPGENTDIWDDNDNFPKDYPLQVVLVDLKTGAEKIVSHGLDGQPADGYSMAPAISDDGRFVVFASDATNLVPRDTNAARDVFLYSTQSGHIRRLSVDSRGHEAVVFRRSVNQVAGDLPTISGDGSTVAFISDARLTADGSYHNPQTTRYVGLFVRNLRTGAITPVTDLKGRVARTIDGPANQDAYDGDGTAGIENGIGNSSGISRPALSRDGRVLAFAMSDYDCYNSNYADFGVNTTFDDVFIRDLRTRRTVLASPGPASPGCQSGSGVIYYTHVALDASGRRCLFTAHSLPSSGNSYVDSAVFLFDPQLKGRREVSAQPAADSGALHEQSSGEGALSAAAASIAFASGPLRERSNQQERRTETPALIYRTPPGSSGSPNPVTGDPAANTDTYRSPSLSADGRVLVFITSASLSPDDPGFANGPSHYAREDVYVQIL